MSSLLGKARVIDDPGLDWPLTLDFRQDLLTHFGQELLVRPRPLPDKMQQRLMLRCRSLRRRHRRHRLHALAITWHYQAHAIVAERSGPVLVADHAHKTLDVARKTRFNIFRSVPATTHSNPLWFLGNRRQLNDSRYQHLRLFDSVRLIATAFGYAPMLQYRFPWSETIERRPKRCSGAVPCKNRSCISLRTSRASPT